MNPFNISPIAYHLYTTSIESVIQESVNDGGLLPSSLIVSPGRYSVMGKTYEMQNEGLYRFVDLSNRVNVQRIVYSTNPIAVVSAAQWLITQSYAHNSLTDEQKTTQAKSTKVMVSCQPGAFWMKYILNTIGYRARVFAGITSQPSNNYSDGHSVCEVSIDGKWVVFDTTLNTRFFYSGTSMSGIEFVEHTGTMDYDIEVMGGDTSYDLSGTLYLGYSGFGFYEPLSNIDWMKQWYSRMFEIPLIYDSGKWYYYDEQKKEQFSSWGYVLISKSDFLVKFYS